MQNIKFRAFSLKTNDWVYGYYAKFRNFKNEVYECIIPMDKETGEAYMENITSFAEGSLGQFTGMYDKNGKEIYENDIVRILYTDWTSKSDNDQRTLDEYLRDISKIGIIEWDKFYPQYCIHFMDKDNYGLLNYGKYGYIEVIGNVFQSKDLL